jgi:TRAP-type mannitol/chloroaromatic compound transport system permease large subunit
MASCGKEGSHPPVPSRVSTDGYALFYLKGTVPEGITLLDIYRGIVPFVILQAIGLILCAIYPQLITYLPTFVTK